MGVTVNDVMRRFLPGFKESNPPLSPDQWRALRAMEHCRTPALGGQLFRCRDCREYKFAYHSCNHRSCAQCGRDATRQWVDRELGKLVGAPYFMVTFTLPSELRDLFFGPQAKDAFDLFFRAASKALAEKLALPKYLGASVSGFTAILHTWNQQLQFHPHIHFIVPGAGIGANGTVVTVKDADYLVHIPTLKRAFRWWFRRHLEALDWEVDPQVWNKQWGVNIKPFGSGINAVKYLGAYVSRPVIGDHRIVAINEHDDSVTFWWKDRDDGDRRRLTTIPGEEFVRRYFRHVLPRGMRSIRYFGFCHPAAKNKRERIAFHTGQTLVIGSDEDEQTEEKREATGIPECPCCRKPMTRIARIKPDRRPCELTFHRLSSRGPPAMASCA